MAVNTSRRRVFIHAAVMVALFLGAFMFIRSTAEYKALNCSFHPRNEETADNAWKEFQCITTALDGHPTALLLFMGKLNELVAEVDAHYAHVLNRAGAEAAIENITRESVTAATKEESESRQAVVEIILANVSDATQQNSLWALANGYVRYRDQATLTRLESTLQKVPGLLDAGKRWRAAQDDLTLLRLRDLSARYQADLLITRSTAEQMRDIYGPMLVESRRSGMALVLLVSLSELQQREQNLFTKGAE